jgi:hypothetical protein
MSDVAAFSKSIHFNGHMATCVRDAFPAAVVDGFGAAMLPEPPRTVPKGNNIEITPASDGAPP